MKELDFNGARVVLSESEAFQMKIEHEQDIMIPLTIKENVFCSLFIECNKAALVTMKMEMEENSHCTLLFWNHCSGTIQFHEEITLQRDAVLNLSFGELSDGCATRHTEVHLRGENAQVNLFSAILTQSAKEYTILCEHHVPFTYSTIKNYFVLLEKGVCKIDATGRINKGALGSKSHQVSKGLTFGSQKSAVILPQLLIDENDVEASHAATLGQIDENQMYYLQSRGMSERQATQLITYGYLLPIAEAIKDEALKQKCIHQIEMKVSELCLMSTK